MQRPLALIRAWLSFVDTSLPGHIRTAYLATSGLIWTVMPPTHRLWIILNFEANDNSTPNRPTKSFSPGRVVDKITVTSRI
ncbi:hypothetical protein VTL71DRAFT_4076 [Oculimacula yallundae]|uniref:Secreted protein n=1 Tax=Oculimacula yallundae TaxID=86028 RepID=A0ABR4C6H6_9HELO